MILFLLTTKMTKASGMTKVSFEIDFNSFNDGTLILKCFIERVLDQGESRNSHHQMAETEYGLSSGAEFRCLQSKTLLPIMIIMTVQAFLNIE